MICADCRDAGVAGPRDQALARIKHGRCRERHEKMYRERGTGPELGSSLCDCRHVIPEKAASD